jgi:cysteinyl-tRNA synthetase
VSRATKKETHTAEEVKALLATHHFLGVGQRPIRSWFRQAEQGKLDVKSIEKLLAERDQARQIRDFEAADRIRDQLESQGILIEDSNGKTKWRHQ